MVKKYTRKGRVSRSAGRFSTRYGRRDRKLIADIEEKMHSKYICNVCTNLTIKRIGTGIWKCSKCDNTFAGGTYIPQTPGWKAASRSIRKVTEQTA